MKTPTIGLSNRSKTPYDDNLLIFPNWCCMSLEIVYIFSCQPIFSWIHSLFHMASTCIHSKRLYISFHANQYPHEYIAYSIWGQHVSTQTHYLRILMSTNIHLNSFHILYGVSMYPLKHIIYVVWCQPISTGIHFLFHMRSTCILLKRLFIIIIRSYNVKFVRTWSAVNRRGFSH